MRRRARCRPSRPCPSAWPGQSGPPNADCSFSAGPSRVANPADPVAARGQSSCALLNDTRSCMSKNIMFVHGMFLTPKSWKHWEAFFTQRGYHCIAPAWPLHDAEPASIRANPPAGLGELSLEKILMAMERAAAPYRDDL